MKTPSAGILCLLAYATVAWPQKQTAGQAAATTTVSGHVYCADTNAPARMATVILQPADAIDAITPGESKTVTSSGETAQTSMDGSFTIQHVAPGTYYVIASQAGYISPLALRYIGPGDDPLPKDQKKDLPAPAPRIAVEGNLPVAVNVTIERGAAVSGTALYDDGSPASGIQVSLLTRRKNGWTMIMFSSPVSGSGFFAHTDDQGHYRLTGLPAGKYLLKADLNLSKTTYRVDERGGSFTSSGNGFSLAIYNGSTMREKDAEPVALTQGEERRGVDIEIPASKLHTVRGNVLAAHDGHVLNGGSLQLLYPDDKSMVAVTSLTKDDDTFNFSFVPEGDYILRVDGATDVEYREISNGPGQWPPTHTEPHVIHQYGPADQPIHVTGDLSSVTISAPDLPAPKAQSPQ